HPQPSLGGGTEQRRGDQLLAQRGTGRGDEGIQPLCNVLGQILLAKRMGKTRVIAETGAVVQEPTAPRAPASDE
ncbi:MAG: hypothetical protein DI523_27060, partial [Paraburkholderia fungorum]